MNETKRQIHKQLTKIVLMEAEPKDIDGIMELEHKGFEQSVREEKQVFLERINYFPEGFLLLKDTTRDNKIIGYICSEVWKYNEQILGGNFSLGHSIKDYHRIEESELYISSLVVDPDYHNQGLGKKLFDELIDKIHKNYAHIVSTVLIVNESWIKAQRIYRAKGFVPILDVDNFFPTSKGLSQKGIVMRKFK